MKKKSLKINHLHSIIIRYLILVAVAIPNLFLFYAIFTPLTVYPAYFLSKLFFYATLIGNNIILINNSVPIELIKSCIAGAAYYLLLILNLSIPNIKLKKRLIMIGISFLTLLILNIIRIVSLAGVYISDNAIFDVTHEVFWYALSTVFVIGIWFAEVKVFHIKDIPVYSDIKFLFSRAITAK